MPHHDERPPNALAKGPAKPDDIERARREVGSAEAQHAVATVEAAAVTLRDDLAELRKPHPEPR
jgi:hypothetical protein